MFMEDAGNHAAAEVSGVGVGAGTGLTEHLATSEFSTNW
jgi:hypothetical protein